MLFSYVELFISALTLCLNYHRTCIVTVGSSRDLSTQAIGTLAFLMEMAMHVGPLDQLMQPATTILTKFEWFH